MKKTENFRYYIGGMLRLILVIMAVLVLLCGRSRTVFAAADSPSLDWSMSGQSSVTIKMTDDGGSTVMDGTLTIYQVALLEQDDGNMVYSFTDAFADSGVSLDDVTADSSSLASDLSDYAAVHSDITGIAIKNTDGKVVFDGLELGLYLVVQTTQSDGYYTMNPFLISVPLDEDGSWVYHVDASPKVGTLTPEPEDDTLGTSVTIEGSMKKSL
ncbi:MAG: hypothetical protein LUD14_08390 [Clostridiales bacterium]|nr:hypothetical protein [Clostridiales bacterium]